MDRTTQDLRDRIANLTVQRDALASTICDLKREVEKWKECFKESVKITGVVERQRDEAIRRAEVADWDDDEPEDYEVCYRCGACVRSLCCCHNRNFDVRI